MAENNKAEVNEKVKPEDSGDRTIQETADDSVSGGKNASENHAIRLETDKDKNQDSPSDMELKALTPGDQNRKDLEKNRFEIVEPAEEIMTTNEMKAIGGEDAQMMLEAINKMSDGEEKNKLKEGLKATYSELSKSPDDSMEGGTHKAIDHPEKTPSNDPQNTAEWTSPDSVLLKINASKNVENQSDSPANWLEASQKIAALPLDKQLQVLGAGFSSGLGEYDRQYRERSIGALIGTVQGVGNVLTNIGKMADFSAYIIINDHERASAMGAEFGTALGQTVVGGIKLFEGAHHYLNDVGKASYQGDNTKVFRDIATLGDNLDKAWSELPPREQARIFTKLTTELGADGLMGFGAVKATGKVPQKITQFLGAVADDAKRLHQAGKKVSGKAVQALDDAIAPIVEHMQGPRFAHATSYGADVNVGLNAAEDTVKGAHVLEKRLFTSKYDNTHRLKPIEAARENARIRKEPFDEDAWKKLTPKQKAEKLEAHGYKQIEDPDTPREIVDSKSLDRAHRGDRFLYSETNAEGYRKAHLNANGDLVPPNPDGKYKGRDVEIFEHILQSDNRAANAESPFISVGTEGVLWKYGDGQGITIDMQRLRKAISSGEITDVKIIEHKELLDHINSLKNLSKYDKTMAFRYSRYDNEFLIRGVVPKRFLKIQGDK